MELDQIYIQFIFVYLHGKTYPAEFATSSVKEKIEVNISKEFRNKNQTDPSYQDNAPTSLFYFTFLLVLCGLLPKTWPQSTHLRN